MIEIILTPLIEVFYSKVTEKIIDCYGDRLPFFYNIINKNIYKIGDVRSSIEKINKITIGTSDLKGIYNCCPKVSFKGNLEIEKSTSDAIEEIKGNSAELTDVFGNDTLGVTVEDNITWQSDPIDIDYKSTDFYTIKALRKNGALPHIISGCVLVVCVEEKKIVLHKRSSNSATYPNAIHIFGGAFIGKGQDNYRESEGDEDITRTIQRELHEESRLDIQKERIEKCKISIAEELTTGFLQVTALGLNITKKELEKIRTAPASNNKEGKTVIIGFDDIEKTITGGMFVPTGAAHIILWLGLGAPGTSRKTKFSGKSAQELFSDIVSQKISFPKAFNVL